MSNLFVSKSEIKVVVLRNIIVIINDSAFGVAD